jgi:hypothetical protein
LPGLWQVIVDDEFGIQDLGTALGDLNVSSMNYLMILNRRMSLRSIPSLNFCLHIDTIQQSNAKTGLFFRLCKVGCTSLIGFRNGEWGMAVKSSLNDNYSITMS